MRLRKPAVWSIGVQQDSGAEATGVCVGKTWRIHVLVVIQLNYTNLPVILPP